MMYEGYKVYGPYLNKKDNRLRCVLVSPDGDKKTISYPKYIMEIHLGRYLDADETIDHIDGNPLNNAIENLQVLNRREHCYNDVYRNADIEVTCKMCSKKFTIGGSTISGRNRSDKHQSGYFCSRQCTGRYGKMIQMSLIQHTTEDKVVPNKYRVKSAPEEIQRVEVG